MIFRGTATALITPFTEDDKVDVQAIRNIVDMQIANGINALVALGTTGEPATLSEEEKEQIVRVCVEQTSGKIPLIVGAGSNSTRQAVETCRMAQKLGADALLVVTPYYNKCTQEGLVEHYGAIAEATSLPIICYNVASRTGVNILPETFARIATEHKNVVAIKEASGNISQVAELAALADGCIDIYSGNDDQVVPLLSLGGVGVISVLSNVMPKLTHDMVMSYLNGDVKLSRQLQLSVMNLNKALFCEVNPIPVKEALNMMGWNAGAVRSPLCEMEPQHKELLRKELAAMKLI